MAIALYCFGIQPGGSKWWRFRYRYNGKEKMLSIGTYPEVTLKDARKKRDEANELLKRNIVDPSLHRQEQKQQAVIAATNSFESVARLWWIHWKTGKNERHAGYTIRRLEADVFPFIGGKPVTELTAPLLIMVIKKIEARGAWTSRT